MKKWMIFSLLATIGCTVLALIFGSMAGPELMKEFGQRAAKIKFNDVPFQQVSVKLDAKDIDRLTLKSRAINIEIVPSSDDEIHVDYSYAGEQNSHQGREWSQDKNQIKRRQHQNCAHRSEYTFHLI